jgi:hypothetical protein
MAEPKKPSSLDMIRGLYVCAPIPLKVRETEALVEFVNVLPPPENRGLLL